MSQATDAARASLQGYQALGSDTALNNANTQYGVGESQTRLSALKGLVGNLQSSVEAVDPSVTGRTTGTFTTEGQRQALVSKEQAPILGNLSKQQGALTSEQGDLTQKQTLASQMASALISDDRQKYQRLLDQYNASSAEDAAAEQKRQVEAAAAESTRQFNAQLAASSAAKSAGSAKTPSAADTKSAVQQHVTSQLASSTGSDGHVSNETWAAALNDWQAVGGTVRDFWKQYGRYVNGKYGSSYAGYAQR